MSSFRIETERLVLREWRMADCEPFAKLAEDPEVMRFLPALERSRSDAIVSRMIAAGERDGHCAWVLEARSSGDFLGFCGLLIPPAPLSGIEIGWRLRRSAWGQGLASEAARASLAWGWQNLVCDEIIAFTVPNNLRSRAVMDRIGMTRVEGGDFDHPALSAGDPLRRHVLYSINRPQ
jgi:RimJ/RimL family protein N-acetyltransferase